LAAMTWTIDILPSVCDKLSVLGASVTVIVGA
jgi:hypothetical protein